MSGRPAITAADCRTCGACCVSKGNSTEVFTYGFADMTAKDVARLTPRVRRRLLQIFIGNETYPATGAKQLATGTIVCQFLRGAPGRGCSCAIYETRPEVCQKFRVGSAPCRAARRELHSRQKAGQP